jgi:all-trans-8'-apo-beta-carotenal 15,15'-oxygenase
MQNERHITDFDCARGTRAPALFTDIDREHGFEPMLSVEGRIPADLTGCLYRNGPGLFSVGEHRIGHMFDGDGAIRAFRFEGGKVSASLKFIETPGFLREKNAKSPMYVGYGTQIPSWWRRLGGRPKNVANTNLLPFGNDLLALWEGGFPIAMNPDNLQTRGETDLDGVIKSAFSAHQHRVAAHQTNYNFGIRVGRTPALDLYRLPDQGKAERLVTLPLPYNTMNHDFMATDRYAVFFRAPLKMRHWRQIFGKGTVAENLAWQADEGTEIIIIPFANPKATVRFNVPAFWQWHFINGFDDGDDIVIDFIRNDDFRSDKWLKEMFELKETDIHSPGLYCRARINPVNQTFHCDTITDTPIEFPKVSPLVEGAKHRYAYAVAHPTAASMRYGLQPLLAKYDLEKGTSELISVGPGRLPCEPIFVPREQSRAEDDGYLLSVFYDLNLNRSGLAILNAQAPTDAPLAIAWYDGRMPVSFHGCWWGQRHEG